MFGFGMPEIIIILIIVLVVFGGGKLPDIGSALGKSIRNFKNAANGADGESPKGDESEKMKTK
jgi:sec-independent protein translocase protein TatA